MDSPDWPEHTDFATRIWRALLFALPTGFLLSTIYTITSRTFGSCRPPFFDFTIEPVNLLFRLTVNCFIAAVSPAIFCLYQGWTCWQAQTPNGLEHAIVELVRTGLVPLIIYLIVAGKLGWLRRRTSNSRKHQLRKYAITAMLVLCLSPFADHILSAPRRIADSFRWLSLTNGKSAERPCSIKARTKAALLASTGKSQEAMTVLLTAIDEDTHHGREGVSEWLEWDYSILHSFDRQKKLTTREWLDLSAPAEARLTSIVEKTQNFENLHYTSAWPLIEPLIAQHVSHDAINEGLKWFRVAHKYERLVRGELNNRALYESAELAHSVHADTQALDILQYAIALEESICINDLRNEAEKAELHHYHTSRRDCDLYQKIVDELPANSGRKNNLEKWLHSRELHKQACVSLDKKNYPEAERILLEAAPFDTSDKSCLRAWSIYQNLLGSVELKLNKLDAADKHYQLALANDSFAVDGDPYCAEVARDLCYCAELMQKQGRLADAEGVLRRALEIDTKVLGENAPESKALQEKLIAAYGLSHKYDLIEAIYKNDILRADDARYSRHVKVTRTRMLADFYLSRGDYANAEEQLVKAIELTNYGRNYSSPIITSLDKLGDKYLALKKYPKALLQYERAYQYCDDKYTFEHHSAKRFDKFAKLFTATKEFDKANDAAETALSMRKRERAPAAEIQLSEQACLAIKEQARREGFPLKSDPRGDSPPAVPPRHTTPARQS
jgi:tetratricopeptide (TPR) repeat protein